MNAGHAQVALRKSSTEYAESSKQREEEPHARIALRRVLNEQTLGKLTAWKIRELEHHGSK